MAELNLIQRQITTKNIDRHRTQRAADSYMQCTGHQRRQSKQQILQSSCFKQDKIRDKDQSRKIEVDSTLKLY